VEPRKARHAEGDQLEPKTENQARVKVSPQGKLVLDYLAKATEPRTLIEIAADTALAYASLTVAVRILEAQKLITRTRGRHDNRVIVCALAEGVTEGSYHVSR
jgi:DNA-binding MarR family transcriptional regulator